MKKTTFTLLQTKTRFLLSSVALMAMFLLNTATITAQCSLACNSSTQVSLDETGHATITPATLLNAEATSCPAGDFEVRVYELGTTTEIPTSPIVDCVYEGQSLTVGIWDLTSGNNCWGTIFVEDKLPPQFDCPTDTMVIGCAEIINFDPIVTDNCDPNPTIELISEQEIPLDCDSLYIKRVVRTYQAEDNKGMKSEKCTIVFHLERINLDSIKWPANHDIAPDNLDPLSCDEDYPLDSKGNPDPLYTGVPTLFGDSLWPNTNTFCNSGTFYTDIVLPTVGCTTKIMRTWSVTEWWCSQDSVASFFQVIEVVDTTAPTITCPNTINATTTPSGCDVHILMPPAEVNDNCAADLDVKMTWDGGFLNSNGGIVEIPRGTSIVTYTVHDGCGNYNSCEVTVNVVDETPPVAVCIQNTAVSLTLGGFSYIPATTFDDGSFDECAFDKVLVKRMDDGANCGLPNAEFAESVPVCCADIGQETMIILRAYDKAGNFNDCMVSVNVQDKLAPVLNCPADMTVVCGTFYNPADPRDAFGEATAWDNCTVSITETSVEDFNACGLGTLDRKFTAVDAGGRTDTCHQIITFISDDLFTWDDITWPETQYLEGCLDPATITPEAYGHPTYNEDQCDLVGTNYEDELFYFNQPGAPACFKIIRHWSVIDWCQPGIDYHGNDVDYTIWRNDQIIMISNDIAPTLETSCDPLSTCTYDADCQEGYIELVQTASDDCTFDSELEWEYVIDFNKDGTIDISHSGSGNTANASNDYPIGSHSISWTFFDKCGNNVKCVQEFDIINCKAPTPYCYNGLAIDLMPVDTNNDGEIDGGMVETWASDFDAGSFHPCGNEVLLSFSADTSETSALFTCEHVGRQDIEIWTSIVTPTGLIQAYCETYVIIQDNTNSCPNALVGGVSGLIATEDNAVLENVSVTLETAENMSTSTDTDGEYSFPNMPLGGSYVVNPQRLDNPMEGISTLDLILIQRHILQLKELDSPYKIIAADIDNNGNLNGSDLIDLRKLILGKTDVFTNNESWRFVDATYDFEGTNPLDIEFPETYSIVGLDGNMSVDFVALKVGDVDNTISNQLLNSSASRSIKTLSLQTTDRQFEVGEKVSIAINVKDAATINGYQFTINYDQSSLSYAGFTSNDIEVTEGNFGLSNADRGVITTSWNSKKAVSFDTDASLFTLEFVAKKAGNINNIINVNSSSIGAEAYDTNYEIMNIDFNANKSAEEGYELYQNTPNPFTETTSIAFNLPVSETVSLKVYDLTGKVLKVITDTYNAGMNQIEISTTELNVSGVVYYTLESENFTSTKRMVIIK